MSCHRSGLTALPNHWWAISWTVVDSRATREYTGRVWVSSAYPTVSSSTIAPAELNGYGTKAPSRKAIMSACRSRLASVVAALAGVRLSSTASMIGSPSAVSEKRSS
jgi:hypothetical protein